MGRGAMVIFCSRLAFLDGILTDKRLKPIETKGENDPVARERASTGGRGTV
jgi:hypothetical protein